MFSDKCASKRCLFSISFFKAVPGVPGEDYPIYAEVPETAFSCEGQVEGGYYSGRVTDACLKKMA